MKNFEIEVATVLSDKGHCAFAARATGTLNPRPLISRLCRNAGHAEAAFSGALQSLEELSSFLAEGDAVDISVNFPDAETVFANGCSDPALNRKIRDCFMSLNVKGISVSFQKSDQASKDLSMKAEMTFAMAL